MRGTWGRHTVIGLLGLAVVAIAPPTVAAHGPVPDAQTQRAISATLAPPLGAMPRAGSTSRAGEAGLPAAWCADRTGRTTDDVASALSTKPHIKVVYAYAAGDPNNFSHYVDFIQETAATISDAVHVESGGTRSVRWDLGTSCGEKLLDVTTVALPGDDLAYSGSSLEKYNRITADVRAALGPPPAGVRQHLLIWADNLRDVAAGIAKDTSAFSTPGSDNPTNLGGYAAILVGNNGITPAGPSRAFMGSESPEFGIVAATHELFHVLGAVLDVAPNNDGAGHCRDRFDVMCYASTDPPVCGAPLTADSLSIDCNKDDYFRPQGGLVGASGQAIWNTYDSVFLCPPAACTARDPAPPPPPASTGPPPPGGATATPSAPAPTTAKVTSVRVVGTPRVGTVLRADVRVSGAGTAVVTVVRRVGGRRKGSRCVAPKRAHRGRRCLRDVRVVRRRIVASTARTTRLRLVKLKTAGRYRIDARMGTTARVARALTVRAAPRRRR